MSDERLRKYSLMEIASRIGNAIIETPETRVIQSWPYNADAQSDACSAMDSDSVRLRADVWIVEPEADAL